MNKSNGFVLWLTGLSGSGKSTLAKAIREKCCSQRHVIILDGDEVRAGLCSDLQYTDSDRTENVRRLSEVATLCADSGAIVIVAAISPFHVDRMQARGRIGAHRFMEIFCHCQFEICRQRDVKGHYRRALAGEIAHFTGVSSPYEVPTEPDLVLDTAGSLDDCLMSVMGALIARKMFS